MYCIAPDAFSTHLNTTARSIRSTLVCRILLQAWTRPPSGLSIHGPTTYIRGGTRPPKSKKQKIKMCEKARWCSSKTGVCGRLLERGEGHILRRSETLKHNVYHSTRGEQKTDYVIGPPATATEEYNTLSSQFLKCLVQY